MFDVDFVEWLQHLVALVLCLSFRQLVKVLDEAQKIYAIVGDSAVEYVDAV